MASEHTAKAFDSDLQELTRLVAEMGGLAERRSSNPSMRWSAATSRSASAWSPPTSRSTSCST